MAIVPPKKNTSSPVTNCQKSTSDIAGFPCQPELLNEPDKPSFFKSSHPIWKSLKEGFLKSTSTNQTSGPLRIAGFVKTLPNSPGVYRMINKKEEVLYVGKAKNLKKRVHSYTNSEKHTQRINRMIFETENMEFILTNTETEALLLEANLIKTLKPKYNILLRDDKSFPYIYMNTQHHAPGVFKYRGSKKLEGKFYGPFPSVVAVNQTLQTLQRAFLLRTCTDTKFSSRTQPCLLYQIKRCSAPCTQEISKTDYDFLVSKTINFLEGKSQQVQKKLADFMEKASNNMAYETAAFYRDRLSALSHVRSYQTVYTKHIREADVFVLAREGETVCLQVFFIRFGQNLGNKSYFPNVDPDLSCSKILSAFIAQFYDNKPLPKKILIAYEIDEQKLLEQALNYKQKQKTHFIIPARGEKKDLIKSFTNNALAALKRKTSEKSSQIKILKTIADLANMKRPIQRIEVYDNSHLSGTNPVGVMIVFGIDGFVKNQYRKFNIKSKTISRGDDFGMMKEVFNRRFSRLLKETQNLLHKKNNQFPLWPDLVLIDGGTGQVSAVYEILQSLNIPEKIAVIGIAKGVNRNSGQEKLYINNNKSFIRLSPTDPTLYFLQRLRDEAHRFALKSQTLRRKKDNFKNLLDEIPLIGPKRKQALLNQFGTVEAIKRAAVKDLMTVELISESLASKIHHWLKNI